MILYELLTHRLPYAELNSFAVPLAIARGQRPELSAALSVPERALAALMRQCWDVPDKRPKAHVLAAELRALRDVDVDHDANQGNVLSFVRSNR